MNAGETDKRRLARELSRFAVTCSSAGAKSPAELRDIAALGCSLRTEEPILVAGNRVRMQIAQLSTMEGEVIWHDGLDAGIAFATPLHQAVVEFIALRLECDLEAEGDMVHRDGFGRPLPALGDPDRRFGLPRGARAR